jgi:hypothetical protein
MQTWAISRQSGETFASLDRIPFWAWAAQVAGEEICDLAEKVTGVCLCAPPDWLYAIRWGEPEEDGYTPKSAGHLVSRFGQALCTGFGAWKQEKEVARLPVTDEQVREWNPDWPWGDDGGSE